MATDPATLTRDLKAFARDQGADLIGIGSMNRFDGAGGLRSQVHHA